MTEEQIAVARECAARSVAGTISFGDVVAHLVKAGVERYHADYSRMEITYYVPDGGSCVVSMGHAGVRVADAFSARDVESSVRQAQRGEIQYPRFVEQTAAAGCVGYLVQIRGRRVHYFGREGDVHTEWFPGARRQ